MEHRFIYLDNNSSTPLDPSVLEVMSNYFTSDFGNASSTHMWGMKARTAIEKARDQIASEIKSKKNEIIFTSGATESINLAIKGYLSNFNKDVGHIITQVTEHKAVLETYRYFENQGWTVSYLPVNADGQIDLVKLKILEKDFSNIDYLLDRCVKVILHNEDAELFYVHFYKTIEYSEELMKVGQYELGSKCTNIAKSILSNSTIKKMDQFNKMKTHFNVHLEKHSSDIGAA
jgi:hypothetical protein